MAAPMIQIEAQEQGQVTLFKLVLRLRRRRGDGQVL